ncbi:MAG: NAD-dependent epimerase/dehydratase family protein [Acidobacteria bacterium]|nr:NAD-dependent epimerase/dehydratase family protein [Acidobacteriota bacterium]
MKAFITGATGLAGGHLVEQLLVRGDEVAALVRPTSDTRFLQRLGAPMVTGDLSDQASLQRGMTGADVVFHTAAKVTDWGPWPEFQRDTIDGTHRVLEAMRATGVRRLVHVSSVAVYGQQAHRGGIWTEEAPYPTHFLAWEYYSVAKIAAEKLVLGYHQKKWVEATIIRPSWIYGPRDRASFPRLVQFLKDGPALLIGKGDNYLPLVYAGNVAEACILAATKPVASGRIYNVSYDGCVTQRQYFNAVAQALGLRPVTRSLPAPVALALANLIEIPARFIRQKDPPSMSRLGFYIVTNKGVFDTTRAREELGWQPRVGFEEGLAKTIEWYKTEYQTADRR